MRETFIISVQEWETSKLGTVLLTVDHDLTSAPEGQKALTPDELEAFTDALKRHVARFLHDYTPKGYTVMHVARQRDDMPPTAEIATAIEQLRDAAQAAGDAASVEHAEKMLDRLLGKR